MEWTKRQKEVIDTRNRNILVSAAAGSGKTAVLVQRIIEKITDKENPIDIDKLLVLTFTRAAASEMSERIREQLTEMADNSPNDKNLQRQLSLIHNACITTIDSFCSKVVRENFDKANVDPNFRIADSVELELLSEDILNKLIEEKYEEEDKDFLKLVKQYSKGRVKEDISSVISKLNELAEKNVSPNTWLENCRKVYDINDIDDLNNSEWMQTMIRDIKRQAKHYSQQLEEVVKICDEVLQESKAESIYSYVVALKKIDECNTYSEIREKWPVFDGRKTQLPRKLKKIDPAKGVYAANTKNATFNSGKEIGEIYLGRSIEQIEKEIKGCKSQVNCLIDLTLEYRRRLEEQKLEKNIMDFNDVAMAALNILNDIDDNGNYTPSDTAKAMSKAFEEIMIDEYQDSNIIQELILSSLTKGYGYNNMFMVGDVKQSIYRFRNAMPRLFLNKYNEYSANLNDESVKIVLDANFRSREEIINSINFIFDFIMHKELGGIQYDDNNRLRFGADYYPEINFDQNNNTEMVIIEDEDGLKTEASYVASRIKEMVEGECPFMVSKNDGFRKAEYKDIVILLKEISTSGKEFKDELEALGIPVHMQAKSGYFETYEIQMMVDILTVINNPHQDIPLVAVMRSVIFGFDANELALIKMSAETYDFYSNVLYYSNEGEDEKLRDKTKKFLDTINHYRKLVKYITVYDLINDILNNTGLEYYIRSLPNGDARLMNLEILKQKANDYDAISYKGLFNFIRYIEKIKDIKGKTEEPSLLSDGENAVQITTIHKSKGLQYPIVFVSNMKKSLSAKGPKSSKNPIYSDDNGNIAVEYIDEENMTCSTTLLSDFIKREEQVEEMAENLRVLYVALTRAKEKLIITNRIANTSKASANDAFKNYRFNENKYLHRDEILDSSTYTTLLGKALAMNKSYNEIIDVTDEEIIALIDNPRYKKDANIDFKFVLADIVKDRKKKHIVDEAINKNSWLEEILNKPVDNTRIHEIKKDIDFDYPYNGDISIKSKVSVTELKKKYQQQEDVLDVSGMSTAREPQFLKKKDDEDFIPGNVMGSTYHRIFELLDFDKEYSREDIKEFINSLVKDSLIDSNAAKYIKLDDILSFTKSKLFERMRKANANGKLYREQKFLLGVKASEIYDTDSDEMVIMQGIIDAMFVEDDQLVIVDYKTDRVDSLDVLVDRYKVQLNSYKEASKRITDLNVKETIIYSTRLRDYKKL